MCVLICLVNYFGEYGEYLVWINLVENDYFLLNLISEVHRYRTGIYVICCLGVHPGLTGLPSQTSAWESIWWVRMTSWKTREGVLPTSVLMSSVVSGKTLALMCNGHGPGALCSFIQTFRLSHFFCRCASFVFTAIRFCVFSNSVWWEDGKGIMWSRHCIHLDK